MGHKHSNAQFQWFVASLIASLLHFAAYCLLSVHTLHINVEGGREVLSRVISFTILWSA